MADVILYTKQKDQLAKAAGKVFDAFQTFAVVLAGLGISPTGASVQDATAQASAPAKKPRAKKAEKQATPTKASKNGSSAFSEL